MYNLVPMNDIWAWYKRGCRERKSYDDYGKYGEL